METSILEDIGLTKTQASTYVHLLEKGQLTPSQLASLTKQSRTSAYMSLSKIEELGLANTMVVKKKLVYVPLSPSNLEKITDKLHNRVEQSKKAFDAVLPSLLTNYYQNQQTPGVQFFEGSEGIRRIYKDHIATGKDVYFVRTPADEDYFGEELYTYMRIRARSGIRAIGLAPYSENFKKYADQHDKILNREMHWFPFDAYTTPVEISVYGNKVGFIAFGDELVATIIDSPLIAAAMRQLFALATLGGEFLLNKSGDSTK